ncbi:MAG: methyltransferase domain-containing protein [Chloroflexi bacterium]|nr:methyltransferase domain-containing protein [Chloroflexota bacterium]
MPGDQRPAPSLLTRFLIFFFYLLYQPLAWSYDLVAWLVSLGRWKTWVYTSLPELSGPRVLELGHGPGHLQQALHRQGIQVFGIDRSPQMARIAYRRISRGGAAPKLVRASAEHLPFTGHVFDQLVATFPSEYIVQPATLSEARRVLISGGKLVVLPVAWIRGNRLWERLAAWLFRVTGQAPDWDSLFSDPLRKAGFAVAEKRIELAGSEVMQVIAKSN